MGYQVFGIAPSVHTKTTWGVLSHVKTAVSELPPFRGQETATIPAVANALDGNLPDGWRLLGDRNYAVAKTFGVGFRKEDNEKEWYWCFNDINFNGPAFFVIDGSGIVQYEWYWRNHHSRLGAETVSAILKSLHDADSKVYMDLGEALENPETVLRLNLSYQGLEDVPPDIGRLVNLEDLRLNGNNLKELPDEIGLLSKLKRLELSENAFGVLPSVVGQLEQLEKLNANRNPLRTLPSEIGQLANLRYLNVMYCPLETLPAEIGALGKLQVFRAAEHRLKTLPPEIGKLTELMHLFLAGTRRSDGEVVGLETLPDEIGFLTNVVELQLINNRLVRLPDGIGNLHHLEYLDVSNNLLVEIPFMGRLTRLGGGMSEGVNFSGNHLTSVPVEFAGMGLWRVRLERNRITEVPAELGNVGTLDLWSNRLTRLPSGMFGEGRKLSRLDVSYNRLSSFPDEPGMKSKMDVLNLSNNLLTEIPAKVIEWNPRSLNLQNNRIAKVQDAACELNRLGLEGNPIPLAERDRLRKIWHEKGQRLGGLRF